MDKVNLIKHKQRSCTEEEKPKDLFFNSHQQVMSSHLPGSRASVCVAVAPEDKSDNNECLPHFLLFLRFCC